MARSSRTVFFGRLKDALGLGAPAPSPLTPTVEIEVDGLQVSITRKPIRSLRLMVLSPSAKVRLSAPKRIAQREILAFIHAKAAWIRQQQQRIAALAPLSVEADSPALKAEHRRQLKAQIPGLIAHWEPKLGVKVAQWGIRAMRSRWGSCNPRAARLSFSLGLAKHPADCLEYIVVHEMLHLLEPGHGAAYKTLMQQHYPGWRACRDQLNGKKL